MSNIYVYSVPVMDIHIYACKRLLDISSASCNDTIMSDLGRFTMFINASKRCIKFWIRLSKLPNLSYPKLWYEMLKLYDSLGYTNCVTHISQRFLVLYGKGKVLIVLNCFKSVYSAFFDQYIQNWKSQCESNRKLSTFKKFRADFVREPYIFTYRLKQL